MDIDPDIANWIIEFLLRQPPLDDRTLNSLLRSLPLPINNPNLLKSLLLKKLDSDVSRRSISDSTLKLLEKLEEIEFRRGNEAVSDAMKRAYCAVAVDCTLRHLIHGGDDDKERSFKFFLAVKRLWRGRIARMKKVLEKGGLGSEQLWAWKHEIEAAAWEDRVCERVIKKFEGVRAEEAVRVYVREERERMGPSFLESVAERVKRDDGLQRIMGVKGIGRAGVEETPSRGVDRAAKGSNASKGDHRAVNETPSCRVDWAANGSNASKSDRAANETPSCRVDWAANGSNVSKGDRAANETPPCRVDRAANGSNSSKEKHKGKQQTVDSDETNAEPSHRRNSLLSTAEVNRAREALVASTRELKAAVKDPLPEALRVAEAICKLQKSAVDSNGDAIASEERQKCQKPAEDGNRGNMNNVPKPSLMQRNSSAHTYKWDDSIDESSEDIACTAVLQLHTPKRICTSPLKTYEFNNIKKRRKGRRWSPQEENALRARVEEFGKGNWKAILNFHGDEFIGRTEVDLKDKWRNMMRY